MMTCSRHNQTNFEVPHPVHKVSYLHRSYIFSDLEYLSFEVRWCRPFQEYRYKNLQKIRDAIRKKKLVCLIKLVRPRTLCKKDWILLMFLLYNFMISIYSSISIEIHWNSNISLIEILLNSLKAFLLHWLLLYIKQTFHNFLFSLLEETNAYCHYLLKQSFLQIPFKIFLSWFWNLPRREKSVARPSSHPYGFTNYELRISGYQLKVHKFFWQWDGVLILPKLSH